MTTLLKKPQSNVLGLTAPQGSTGPQQGGQPFLSQPSQNNSGPAVQPQPQVQGDAAPAASPQPQAGATQSGLAPTPTGLPVTVPALPAPVQTQQLPPPPTQPAAGTGGTGGTPPTNPWMFNGRDLTGAMADGITIGSAQHLAMRPEDQRALLLTAEARRRQAADDARWQQYWAAVRQGHYDSYVKAQQQAGLPIQTIDLWDPQLNSPQQAYHRAEYTRANGWADGDPSDPLLKDPTTAFGEGANYGTGSLFGASGDLSGGNRLYIRTEADPFGEDQENQNRLLEQLGAALSSGQGTGVWDPSGKGTVAGAGTEIHGPNDPTLPPPQGVGGNVLPGRPFTLPPIQQPLQPMVPNTPGGAPGAPAGTGGPAGNPLSGANSNQGFNVEGRNAIGLEFLGGLIERLLANPSRFDTDTAMKLRETFLKDQETEEARGMQDIEADAVSRGLTFSDVPYSRSGGIFDLKERLARARGAFESDLLEKQATTWGGDMNNAIRNALDFGSLAMGGESQLDALAELALRHGGDAPGISEMIGAILGMQQNGSGGINPILFQLLGQLFPQGDD